MAGGITQLYPDSGSSDALKIQGKSVSGIAPTDGQVLEFQAAIEEYVPSDPASPITISETAPENPSLGDQWFCSANAQTYTWYSDAWVEVGGAGIAGLGTTDTVQFGPTTVSALTFSDTVWEDLRFPAQAINPAGAASPPTVSQTTGMLEFQGSTDNAIAGQAQLPHAWKYGTALHVHLHLIFPTANTSNSRWKLEYKIFPVVGTGAATYAAAYSDGGTITVPNPNVASKIEIHEWDPISMAGQVGSCSLLWKISRLASSDAADNDTSVIVLTEFDIHYEIDKLGSPDELPV